MTEGKHELGLMSVRTRGELDTDTELVASWLVYVGVQKRGRTLSDTSISATINGINWMDQQEDKDDKVY